MERGGLLKLSDLTEVSIYPKPIERQRVSTYLQVFSEKTYAALLTHPSLKTDEVKDSAAFIAKVVKWWKILNVKSIALDIRKNDDNRAPAKDPQDHRLIFFLEFGDMCIRMAGKQGRRIKQLSRDTAASIHQTCYGLVGLCRHLLATSHHYVLFGHFTSDHLEKDFSKLRQG